MNSFPIRFVLRSKWVLGNIYPFCLWRYKKAPANLQGLLSFNLHSDLCKQWSTSCRLRYCIQGGFRGLCVCSMLSGASMVLGVLFPQRVRFAQYPLQGHWFSFGFSCRSAANRGSQPTLDLSRLYSSASTSISSWSCPCPASSCAMPWSIFTRYSAFRTAFMIAL